MNELDRLRFGLDEIHNHFDDQGFGHHDKSQCASALVNYAGAVLGGYEKTLSEWWDEQDQSTRYPYSPRASPAPS